MLQLSCNGTPDIGPFMKKAKLTIIVDCEQQGAKQDHLATVNVEKYYRQTSDIRRTKSGVKSRIKMQLEQHRHAIL